MPADQGREYSVIVDGARTAFGRYGGALAPLSAVDLGAAAIRGALERTGGMVKDEDLDHALMGVVLAAGLGQVPSRQATVAAGLPVELTSETVNKVCASGLRAVTMADQMIRCGDVQAMVAGGMESMSNAPYLLRKARFGYRMGDGTVEDAMVGDGLRDPIRHVHMGIHNSKMAEEFSISREEQDAWALRSHQLALAAQDEGRLGEEIVAVGVPDRKGKVTTVDVDEGPRRDTSLERLASLRPAFTEDGTTTAGNAPGVNDGAGALVVTSGSYAAERDIRPLARILSWATVGQEPQYLHTVPALASRRALGRIEMDPSEVDLWELNEAFAAVTLNSTRMLGIDADRVNVNGGAVALGHPIGASGARILLTLAYELRRRGGGVGVAAICSGTAQGDAVVIEVEK